MENTQFAVKDFLRPRLLHDLVHLANEHIL